MNPRLQAEIDEWLRTGGRVVAASDRAARALLAGYHRARRTEGLEAWATPAIADWTGFVRVAWERLPSSNQLVLNAVQEEALWNDLASRSRATAAALPGPRHRLAALAAQAHALLCSYDPWQLAAERRAGWSAEAGVFSQWLAGFEQICTEQGLTSAARLPLEVIAHQESAANAGQEREKLLLVGFDRILPTQRRLLESWGEWRIAPTEEPAGNLGHHAAADPQRELEACALWCAERLEPDPAAKLMLVAQNAPLRRGEIERALLRYVRLEHTAEHPAFEFSLGVPLGETALARSAWLLLKWLSGPLTEPELDWLLASGRCAATEELGTALMGYQHLLRRHGMERTQWTLSAWRNVRGSALPPEWMERMAQAQGLVEESKSRPASPVEWAARAPRVLEAAGWPGERPLTSAEFQALTGWQQALETAGSLGFDGRRCGWNDFLAQLERVLESTLYSPQSEEAPIQIVGPAESAGLEAGGIWFLGAGEDGWPPAGSTHPLLPLAVQRESGMPFADPLLDDKLAQATLRRLAASAPEARFSFALRNEKAECRPSQLIVDLAGEPGPMPSEWCAPPTAAAATVAVRESEPIPLPPATVPGGAGVLTAQSQCPFRAFATVRLGAQGWNPAQPCLTAAQRGQLLHEALHSIWSGPPQGLRSHADLAAVAELAEFVGDHVRQAMKKTPASVRASAPHRYLELEEERLGRLLTEWLAYERERVPFTVEGVELAKPVTITGLTLNLRLDRLDRLCDESVLVVDYKTGATTPASWELPRPDDVQLPLYAAFGLDEESQQLGGLALAKIQAGKNEFAGRVADAVATLLPSLKGTSGLLKKPLNLELLLDWKDCIQRLAEDFLSGRAVIDPIDAKKSCRYCDLSTLCRHREENEASGEDEESEEDNE